ncbi:hypothetical protein GOP47_0026709 [Adiantum capillus-veneris]|nr:hypothetical protein GOP47_0026709 [Adiantum capillus-veneris]
MSANAGAARVKAGCPLPTEKGQKGYAHYLISFLTPEKIVRGTAMRTPSLGHLLVKILCKADKTFNLAIRNDTPVMAPADSLDPTQMWIKDQTYGARTKDNYGSPAFALVNKATGQALKHGKEKGHQLHLVEYRPGMLDEDILFSESQDFGEGFRAVRMASDTLLNMTLKGHLLFLILGMSMTINFGRSSRFE